MKLNDSSPPQCKQKKKPFPENGNIIKVLTIMPWGRLKKIQRFFSLL
jgi:hypothetical protein